MFRCQPDFSWPLGKEYAACGMDEDNEDPCECTEDIFIANHRPPKGPWYVFWSTTGNAPMSPPMPNLEALAVYLVANRVSIGATFTLANMAAARAYLGPEDDGGIHWTIWDTLQEDVA